MKDLNKKSKRYVITTATIFTLAIMIAASSMIATTTPTASASTTATTTTEEEATTTTTPMTTTTLPPEGIQLSAQPVYQERQITVGENLINETHVETTFTANGTLTLPNTTETIDTTATGSILISFVDSTGIGREVITTEDGSESATAKFFGIARFGMEEEGRGIVISVVDTNSTGRLAQLDGMILAGLIEFPPEDETSSLSLWEWQSGIPLLPTTTTTDATTTTPTDADGATSAAPGEEGAIGLSEGQISSEEQQQAAEEQAEIETQQQQETTPTIPPNPLFE